MGAGGWWQTMHGGTTSSADLRCELCCLLRRVRLAVPADVPAADVLDGDVLHVEANVVPRQSLAQGLVVHLHGLHLSGDVHGCKGDHHAGPQDASLYAAHGDCADPCGDKDKKERNVTCLAYPWARAWLQQKQDISSGLTKDHVCFLPQTPQFSAARSTLGSSKIL